MSYPARPSLSRFDAPLNLGPLLSTSPFALRLASIESEILLLKKLRHPNIVQYVDVVKTAEELHIVLELMESGSLAAIMKKYGTFTETLCVVYLTQVLRGLQFLHQQGVVHRDIKGEYSTDSSSLVFLSSVAYHLSPSSTAHSLRRQRPAQAPIS